MVLPRLLGSVFHVTSGRALRDITAARAVYSNGDGRFPFTFPQSQNSYGRMRGWVCLFDFRNVSGETIRDASVKFNFLKPTKADPVFLFLDPCRFEQLVPWTHAPVGAMVIPHVETWYPGNLPVAGLAHALAVTIEEDDADSSYRGIMRRLH